MSDPMRTVQLPASRWVALVGWLEQEMEEVEDGRRHSADPEEKELLARSEAELQEFVDAIERQAGADA